MGSPLDESLEAIRAQSLAGMDVGAGAAQMVGHAVALISSGRVEEGESLLERLDALLPNHPDCLHFLGVCLQMRGERSGAEALIRRALALSPGRADYWCNLGTTLLAGSDWDQAEDCFRRALRRAPGNLNALNNLGAVLIRGQNWPEAVTILEQVVAKSPGALGPSVNLARAMVGCGRFDDAAHLCSDLLAQHGDDLDVHLCLADALAKSGDLVTAVDNLRHALDRWPVQEVANNLASLLLSLGASLEAIGLYRSVLDAVPGDALVLANLGGALDSVGSNREAVEAYRRSLAIRPDAATHSALLFTMQHGEAADAALLKAEARAWDEAYGRVDPCMYLNAPDPDRRLRVAYLSPDFRNHAVGFFLPGIVAAHDRDQVEVVCYHDHFQDDRVTAAVRDKADLWRKVDGLRDDALVEQIQADAIDVLVDCAGHSGRNRLAALACKPAPIQLAWVLGYAGTTGMAAMDGILADGGLVPEGFEEEFTETVIRLPVFAPFRPDPSWPEVSPLPDGPPVLACLGNPARMGETLIAAWAEILRRLPEATLLLKHGQFEVETNRRHWRERFAPLGDRVRLEGVEGGWAAHMHAYGQIALALDTFPATGTTSTLIPAWMGVPTVSLAGAHADGRFGNSILGSLGLSDLVGSSVDGYIGAAVALARDPRRLAAIRGSLRGRMANGAVCDRDGFVRSAEAAYRAVWRDWCAKQEGAGA